jgi:capsular polysaccharide transport system permease protein
MTLAAEPGRAEGAPEHGGSSGRPAGAAEVVREAAARILRERIGLLGVDRSGAYEHYNLKLELGLPIPPYEIAIVDLVTSRLPRLRSYHEIGSGLGTLPLMLAYEGLPSVGIERDERRHLTATTILRDLSARFPQIENGCRLIGANFPEAVTDLDVSDSMAVVTDLMSTQSPQEYARLCRGLAQYRYVLIDLQRFCISRTSTGEYRQLIAELQSQGLLPCEEVLDFGGGGYYQLFASEASQDLRHMAEIPRSPGAGSAAGEGKRLTVPADAGKLPGLTDRPGDLEVIARDSLPVEALPARGAPGGNRFVLPPLPNKARRRRLGGWLTLSAVLIIGIPSLLAAIYYGFRASDQYVTSFQFSVRGPSATAAPRSANSSLGLVTAMSPDAFVVTDYVNSLQAVTDVERSIDIRAMFTRPTIDYLSRLAPDSVPEELKTYWNHMVSAHFDLVSGNVSVSVRAFTPQESLTLARALIAACADMFRRVNADGQREFVEAADENLGRAERQLAAAHRSLVEFREQSGLVDPDRTAQAGSAILDDLRKQLAALQTQYLAIRAATPVAPALATLRIQITSLEDQIQAERSKVESPLKAVTPEVLARYQSLDLERQFAEKQYTDALSQRGQAYLMAQSQQSFLALFVEPALPHKPLYPERFKAIVTVLLSAAAVWFASMLMTYAVRDHLM